MMVGEGVDWNTKEIALSIIPLWENKLPRMPRIFLGRISQ
jgi:hypothetical protein